MVQLVFYRLKSIVRVFDWDITCKEATILFRSDNALILRLLKSLTVNELT